MTAIIGKGLLFTGCAALGIGQGLALRNRRLCLQVFRAALEGMSRELTFSLSPLSVLLSQAERESTGAVKTFFHTVQREFSDTGGESWSESWQTALTRSNLPLRTEDFTLLREVGQILGRYDSESQRAALMGLLTRLSDAADCAREEERRLSRVHTVTGISAGLFLLLLL